MNMTMSEVFNAICSKRKYDPKDYILKMADTKTDVPLDLTLEQIKQTEFCVLKRSSGGAGDIFLHAPKEVETVQVGLYSQLFTLEDCRSIYKVFNSLQSNIK